MPDNLVKVVMLHAAAYQEKILDVDGKQVMKDIEVFGGTTKVPATRNVYLHDGEAEVPVDIAEILIANGSARYPTVTTIVTPEQQAGLANAPTTSTNVAKGGKAEKDVSLS